MPDAVRAGLLTRYHNGMARRRSAASLVRGAADFCAREQIGYQKSDDYEELYSAHYRRVLGQGSPADCDKVHDRLVRKLR